MRRVENQDCWRKPASVTSGVNRWRFASAAWRKKLQHITGEGSGSKSNTDVKVQNNQPEVKWMKQGGRPGHIVQHVTPLLELSHPSFDFHPASTNAPGMQEMVWIFVTSLFLLPPPPLLLLPSPPFAPPPLCLPSPTPPHHFPLPRHFPPPLRHRRLLLFNKTWFIFMDEMTYISYIFMFKTYSPFLL